MAVEIENSGMQNVLSADEENFDLQVETLLDVVYNQYGYDFRNYAKSSQKRRIKHYLNLSRIAGIDELITAISGCREAFFDFLNSITISTTELFRDPALYITLADRVIPFLKTYPFFKIWHAGCSTGEEVYSAAIFLHEHGLLDKATIYRAAIEQARTGIVSSSVIKRDSRNYYDAGMSSSLSDYWHTRHGYSLLDDRLLRNTVFSEHNLATDSAFSEMQLIFCRNVLIYFDRQLQDRALELLDNSLCRNGMLCLGMKESINFSSIAGHFVDVDRKTRLFRKKWAYS